MAAPFGNEFWKKRSKHGRERIFNSPKVLWEAACEYFDWARDNPWFKQDFIKSGDMGGFKVDLKTERPLSLKGLCIFLGVNTKYFNDFRDGIRGSKKKKDLEYSEIISRITEIIETQQFEGATVGAFNANIISRALGMIDKTETGFRDKDGNPTDPPKQVMIINGKEIQF